MINIGRKRQYVDLTEEVYNNLKCGDVVRCKKHNNVRGKAVELFDGGTFYESSNTLCGCKATNYQVKKNE